jgi:hypothetical protein
MGGRPVLNLLGKANIALMLAAASGCASTYDEVVEPGVARKNPGEFVRQIDERSYFHVLTKPYSFHMGGPGTVKGDPVQLCGPFIAPIGEKPGRSAGPRWHPAEIIEDRGVPDYARRVTATGEHRFTEALVADCIPRTEIVQTSLVRTRTDLGVGKAASNIALAPVYAVGVVALYTIIKLEMAKEERDQRKREERRKEEESSERQP